MIVLYMRDNPSRFLNCDAKSDAECGVYMIANNGGIDKEERRRSRERERGAEWDCGLGKSVS